MKTISITAFPYVVQNGTIEVPDDLKDNDEIIEYIIDNWDYVSFDSPDFDYCGCDFDIDE